MDEISQAVALILATISAGKKCHLYCNNDFTAYYIERGLHESGVNFLMIWCDKRKCWLIYKNN